MLFGTLLFSDFHTGPQNGKHCSRSVGYRGEQIITITLWRTYLLIIITIKKCELTCFALYEYALPVSHLMACVRLNLVAPLKFRVWHQILVVNDDFCDYFGQWTIQFQMLRNIQDCSSLKCHIWRFMRRRLCLPCFSSPSMVSFCHWPYSGRSVQLKDEPV